MKVDAAWPTPLQQLGYNAFVMRFENNTKRGAKGAKQPDDPATLILWNGQQNDVEDVRNSPRTTTSLIDRFDPCSIKLFDLTPYGPNLHHYGVLCSGIQIRWEGNDSCDVVAFDGGMKSGINSCTSATSSLDRIWLSRPLVAVFDTGLSGCIFSDTLWEEIQLERRRVNQCGMKAQQRRLRQGNLQSNDDFGGKTEYDQRNNIDNSKLVLAESTLDETQPIGCTVWLPTVGNFHATTNPNTSVGASSSLPFSVELSSDSNYWRFQSFRLPWWYADQSEGASGNNTKYISNPVAAKLRNNDFPHVVVLGSTFWRNPDVQGLSVDTTSERAKITTVAQR
mmetsp:Transcript_90826/g.185060  ORF Transcript_90826/g.185060 Transcript_90826/m.185060 type:complete len:337 (+) Transcript_90826:2-1012(+)